MYYYVIYYVIYKLLYFALLKKDAPLYTVFEII